jgi:hypothetical protein
MLEGMYMAALNYWKHKDSELIDELKERGIHLEDYNRKDAIAALKALDMKESKEADVMEDVDEEDEIKAIGLDELKKDKVQLMLRRVIFHNTHETDLPHIFIGHNGRGFYLPREVEIDVPCYLLDSCIKDAVEDRLVNMVDERGNIVWKVRRVQRFPYTVVKNDFPAP